MVVMSRDLRPPSFEFRPEEVLGPLNDVEAKNAPPLLYGRGDRALLDATVRVSVVGSRRATELGLRRTTKLARALVEAGVVVVSGLAEGVDHAAHAAAIELGGRTIAVLGTPLERAYPKQHQALQERIGREHLLVSQWAPGGGAGKGAFPARNRTMALLTHATVIVEAKEGSGTMHQGWEALRLGRPLFVMASAFESGMKWPFELEEYGARRLAKADDLLSILPFDLADAF